MFKGGHGWDIPRSAVVVRLDNKYAQRVAMAPSSAEAIDTIVEELENPDSDFFAKDEDFTDIDWSFERIGEAIGRSYFTFCGLAYGVVDEDGEVVDISKAPISEAVGAFKETYDEWKGVYGNLANK